MRSRRAFNILTETESQNAKFGVARKKLKMFERVLGLSLLVRRPSLPDISRNGETLPLGL